MTEPDLTRSEQGLGTDFVNELEPMFNGLCAMYVSNRPKHVRNMLRYREKGLELAEHGDDTEAVVWTFAAMMLAAAVVRIQQKEKT